MKLREFTSKWARREERDGAVTIKSIWGIFEDKRKTAHLCTLATFINKGRERCPLLFFMIFRSIFYDLIFILRTNI